MKLSDKQRFTPQREQIHEIINQAVGPLSATEIYRLALRKRPDLGLATIYRTLKIMQEGNFVRLVILPDGITRYEKVTAGPNHFCCKVCRRVYDFRPALLTAQAGGLSQDGFMVEDSESTFYGRCPHCREKK